MFRDHVLAKGSVMCIVNADADDMRPIAVHAGESPDEHKIGGMDRAVLAVESASDGRLRCSQAAVRAECHTGTVISPSVTGPMRELYDFELEPEVRDWLDGLSDSDYKRVDEVCGLLAEKGSELGGPWSDHLEGSVWELRLRLRDVAARGHVLVYF